MIVSRKLLVPTLSFFALVLILLIGAFVLDTTSTLRNQEAERLASLQQTFVDQVEGLEDLALALATDAASQPEVQAAFAADSRPRLIAATQPAFLALQQEFDVVQHEFHVAPARSYLRLHRLDVFGDDLASYRFTVLDANLDRRPISGLEIDRAGLSVRGVVPVNYEGQHIGTVEFGLSAGRDLLEELASQSGADWQILLEKNAAELALNDMSVEIEIFTSPKAWGPGPTDDFYLMASTADSPFYAPEEVYGEVLRRTAVASRVRHAGRGYAILSAPLLDYNQEVIGVVEIMLERSAVAAAQQSRLAIGGLAALLTLTVGGAGLALITTRTLRPIATLTETATAIAAGDLSRTVPVTSRDEIGSLARAFNRMTEQLRDFIASLERRVAERTSELEETAATLSVRSAELEAASQRQVEINRQLQEAMSQSQRRAALLQAATEVSHAIAQVRELDQILPMVTELISLHFGFYHVGIFMVDESGQYAVLRASNSQGGQRMLAQGHRLAVGAEGIIGYVTGTGQARISLDVGTDAVYFDNPDLPDTRSEMAVPLEVGDLIIGALDVQSTEEAAFGSEDVAALTALADQITVSIQNARLFERTQQALAQAEAVEQRYLQQEWSRYLRPGTVSSYEYRPTGVTPAGDVDLPEIEAAIRDGDLITLDASTHPLGLQALAMPIRFRNQVIGALGLHAEEPDRVWTDDEIALVQSIADQVGLALENARLFDATERRARREALIGHVVSQVRLRSDVDGILQTAVRELGKALGTPRTFVHLTGSLEPQVAQEVSDDGN